MRGQSRHAPAIEEDSQFVHTSSMMFEWDENKRLGNLEKHGLDVWAVFEGPHMVVPSSHASEKRFLVVGVLNGRHVVAVCTMRDDAVRVISFRRARNDEKRNYEAVHGGGA